MDGSMSSSYYISAILVCAHVAFARVPTHPHPLSLSLLAAPHLAPCRSPSSTHSSVQMMHKSSVQLPERVNPLSAVATAAAPSSTAGSTTDLNVGGPSAITAATRPTNVKQWLGTLTRQAKNTAVTTTMDASREDVGAGFVPSSSTQTQTPALNVKQGVKWFGTLARTAIQSVVAGGLRYYGNRGRPEWATLVDWMDQWKELDGFCKFSIWWSVCYVSGEGKWITDSSRRIVTSMYPTMPRVNHQQQVTTATDSVSSHAKERKPVTTSATSAGAAAAERSELLGSANSSSSPSGGGSSGNGADGGVFHRTAQVRVSVGGAWRHDELNDDDLNGSSLILPPPPPPPTQIRTWASVANDCSRWSTSLRTWRTSRKTFWTRSATTIERRRPRSGTSGSRWSRRSWRSRCGSRSCSGSRG